MNSRLTLNVWVAIGAALSLCLFGSLGLEAQDSVYSDGLFEVGDGEMPSGFSGMGDIFPSAEQPGPDWECIFDANGLPRSSGASAVFAADDISLGVGFESTALYPDGRVSNATVAADHDIGNAYVHMTEDSLGNGVLFAGAERLGAGDSYLDFELNQGLFRLGHGGYGRGEPWSVLGSRIVGDLLLRLNLTGGQLASVAVSFWSGGTWVLFENLDGEGCNLDETLCAVANAVDIDGGPWRNFDTSGDPETISANRFVEVGVAVGAFLGSPVSYGTLRVRTPQDVAFGYFGEGN